MVERGIFSGKMTAAEALARQFHAAYERLAPQYGYETRPDTREFSPASNNGRLMIAVCATIFAKVEAQATTFQCRAHQCVRQAAEKDSRIANLEGAEQLLRVVRDFAVLDDSTRGWPEVQYHISVVVMRRIEGYLGQRVRLVAEGD